MPSFSHEFRLIPLSPQHNPPSPQQPRSLPRSQRLHLPNHRPHRASNPVLNRQRSAGIPSRRHRRRRRHQADSVRLRERAAVEISVSIHHIFEIVFRPLIFSFCCPFDTFYYHSIPSNALSSPPHRPNTPVLSLIATTRPPPPGPGAARRPHAPTDTDIHVTLIRLVEQSTDIVITLNVPQIPSETEAEGPAAGDGDAVRKQLNERTERAVLMKEAWEMVVGSVEIRDWSLFGTE